MAVAGAGLASELFAWLAWLLSDTEVEPVGLVADAAAEPRKGCVGIGVDLADDVAVSLTKKNVFNRSV